MDVISIISIAIIGPIIGSLIGIIHKPTDSYINNFLAFAAGTMLAISFIQLIPQSIGLSSLWFCCGGIITGAFLMYGLDKLIPHTDPVDSHDITSGRSLNKVARYLIIGIALHHFPEGMAIALGAVAGYKVSLVIVLAIAIHDIPEGICTSAPYFYVTKNRLKSFIISSTTAIPTVLGYLFANFLFQHIPSQIIGFVIASTAGLMIYISADELIPTSCQKDLPSYSHSSIFSLIAGIVFFIFLGYISK
jgi:zinc transporter, ZIP family